MMPCCCGCGGEVKPGNTYAQKSCARRIWARRRRGELPPPEEKLLCAYCKVNRVKGRCRKYCDRVCSGWAAAESRTPEQLKASGARLAQWNQRKYRAKVQATVKAICREVAPGASQETIELMVDVGLKTWHAGYRSGMSATSMRQRRQREKEEAA